VIPTKLGRITASSTGGVPKWVFLVDGNPDAEAWLVHAAGRQGEQPALGLVEVRSRQARARVHPDDQMRLTSQGVAAFSSASSSNHANGLACPGLHLIGGGPPALLQSCAGLAAPTMTCRRWPPSPTLSSTSDETRTHVGFGGCEPHFCLGRHLAALELRVGLRALA
jgi:hypothetical protein